MKIVTSLSFQGQCREAFEFYARVLGGRITAAMPYGEGPPDMPVGPQYRDWLMHCWMDVGDQSIMGADMDKDWAPNIDKPKNGFDVTLHTSDRALNQRSASALSEVWSVTSKPFLGLSIFGAQSLSMSAPMIDWSPTSIQQCISQSLYCGPTGMSGGASP